MTRFRPPTVETLFIATVALLALRLGLRPIGDNSTLVHLRTGIDTVDGLGIPRSDPYSFTARGEPWVVQSWFASTVYGALHAAAGSFVPVVLLHGLLYGALGWLLGTLGRTGRAPMTAAVALLTAGIGVSQWSPRPLAFGLVAFGLVVFSVERRVQPLWVVPIVWVWVNSHGSFVLGGLWVVAVVVVDGRLWRYLAAFAAGLVVAAVNPLGPRLLVFPLTLLDHRDNLRRVIEWQPPVPDRAGTVISVGALALGLIVLALRRPPLRTLLPAVPFVALGIAAQRNLALTAIALAPVLGAALRARQAVEPARPRGHIAIAGLVATLAATVIVLAAFRDPLDLDAYPVAALRAVDERARVASTDIGGCYVVFARGRSANVFVDDRYDMYPEDVIDDYHVLLDHGDAGLDVLDEWDVEAVVWPVAERELAASLAESGNWRRVFADQSWVVFVREA